MKTAQAVRSAKPPHGLSVDDYEFLQAYVYRESGIVLERDKRYLIDSRLGPVVKKGGFRTVADLCNLLRGVAGEPGASEAVIRREVINAITTNETFFFRESAQYEALRLKVIPALMAKRRPIRTLRFWSAAASTGQEAYSLAMVLRELGIDAWNVHISATDLNDAVLERARSGRYLPLEVRRGLTPAHLLKYFLRIGHEWQVRDEVRRLVQFETLDLRKSFRSRGPYDVIFCRNVLIYFDLETKRRILAELRGTLAPGGYLLLGGAETTINVDRRFRRVEMGGATLYQAE
jgi:chemotaxis protein methyltransferase CheR